MQSPENGSIFLPSKWVKESSYFLRGDYIGINSHLCRSNCEKIEDLALFHISQLNMVNILRQYEFFYLVSGFFPILASFPSNLPTILGARLPQKS